MPPLRRQLKERINVIRQQAPVVVPHLRSPHHFHFAACANCAAIRQRTAVPRRRHPPTHRPLRRPGDGRQFHAQLRYPAGRLQHSQHRRGLFAQHHRGPARPAELPHRLAYRSAAACSLHFEFRRPRQGQRRHHPRRHQWRRQRLRHQHHRRHPRHRWLLRSRHHVHHGLLPPHALPCCRHAWSQRPARRSRDDRESAAHLPHPGQHLQHS